MASFSMYCYWIGYLLIYLSKHWNMCINVMVGSSCAQSPAIVESCCCGQSTSSISRCPRLSHMDLRCLRNKVRATHRPIVRYTSIQKLHAAREASCINGIQRKTSPGRLLQVVQPHSSVGLLNTITITITTWPLKGGARTEPT